MRHLTNGDKMNKKTKEWLDGIHDKEKEEMIRKEEEDQKESKK